MPWVRTAPKYSSHLAPVTRKAQPSYPDALRCPAQLSFPFWASKARRVHLGLRESSGRRVPLERRVQWVNVVIRGLRGHLVNRDFLGWLERKARRALLVSEAPLEQLAQLVFQGGLAPKGHLALPVRKELR
ncbi:UNVERIFIED_CONTAM: hypothetical protein K2H54_048399 [Gekko kuhli]